MTSLRDAPDLNAILNDDLETRNEVFEPGLTVSHPFLHVAQAAAPMKAMYVLYFPFSMQCLLAITKNFHD